jgi:hypothetical protein
MGYTRSQLKNANGTRLAISFKKKALCKVVRSDCGQEHIRILDSLPHVISWALQGLSVRQCVHHVSCLATQMQLTHKVLLLLLLLLLTRREVNDGNWVCSEQRQFVVNQWMGGESATHKERERERERESRLKETVGTGVILSGWEAGLEWQSSPTRAPSKESRFLGGFFGWDQSPPNTSAPIWMDDALMSVSFWSFPVPVLTKVGYHRLIIVFLFLSPFDICLFFLSDFFVFLFWPHSTPLSPTYLQLDCMPMHKKGPTLSSTYLLSSQLPT